MQIKIMHCVIVPVVDWALAQGPKNSPQDTWTWCWAPLSGCLFWSGGWSRWTQRSTTLSQSGILLTVEDKWGNNHVWLGRLSCREWLVDISWGSSCLVLLEEWVAGWLRLTAWLHDQTGAPVLAVIMCSCCLFLLECSTFSWMKIDLF